MFDENSKREFDFDSHLFSQLIIFYFLTSDYETGLGQVKIM